MRHKSYKRANRLLTAATVCLTVLTLLTAMYGCVVWANLPVISAWRNIWIETAMTTYTHQWLATDFFPQWLIDKVLSEMEMPGKIDVSDPSDLATPTLPPDPLGQKTLVEGKDDPHGNKVLVNDINEGIVIVQIKGSTPIGSYVGKLVLIDDPARVFIGTTSKKGVMGEFICDMTERYNAVIGMNASGFDDPDGHGKGGKINGLCYSEGEPWGKLNKTYSSIIISKSNKLIVGDITDWDKYKARDGAQFFPVIISDGEIVVGNSWSQQPRTIIAQREDGVMMFLVIDGRSVTSVGATYKQCAQTLLEYGAINAAACDGGSSSVLAYNNKLINVPSTPMKDTGRYLPNAFLVRSKKG